MINNLTNQYSVSKTERFSLIPVAQTEENFNNKLLLQQDKQRALNYKKVKGYMDRYHKFFIESVLKDLKLDGVREYSELYNKTNKSEKEIAEMEKAEAKMRKAIAAAFKKDRHYQILNKKEFIRELLPEFLTEKEEKEIVAEFYDFTTYFTGFWQNRENMYTDADQSTAVSYRCINDNLPKFLDNINSFSKVKTALPVETINALNTEFSGLCGTTVEDIFTSDYFSFVLSQSGIDRYNEIIGGYTTSDGQKIQGINEYINLFNQQNAKADKSGRLPLLKPLFKQILSDRDSVSFIPEEFDNDTDLLAAIKVFYDGNNNDVTGFKKTLEDFKELFADFELFDTKGIYIFSGIAITDISNAVFGSWNVIKDNWNAEYEQVHKVKKGKEETFYEEEKKAFKRIKSFSIAELQQLGNEKGNISEYISSKAMELIGLIESSYSVIADFVSKPYEDKIRLSSNDKRIEQIKAFLDSVKELEKLLKPLCGSGKEEDKDNTFYGKFLPLIDNTLVVDTLYNKVRNHVTKKPYSNEKIKLNFENPQFLGGWDKNKERDYRSVLLRKKGKYYLAIMDKSNSKIFAEAPDTVDGEDCFEKVEYKLLPDPSKMLPKVFFAVSNLETFSPSERILKIREKGSFKKGIGFNKKDCHEFIDFYKTSIEKHADWSKFGFAFSETDRYEDISGFFREVAEQGYSIKFVNVSEKYIYDCIENGSLYLFQIYNKDFSEYSKGKPNLHTLYFKMLFDERNLADVVYKLNGQAEMFYREASIKNEEKIVHPANQPLANKNPDNSKKQSEFAYDIIKDRRYTKRQFSLHIPITMNFKAQGNTFINNAVREELKKSNGTHVIGIDRGERNLIYITVVDSNGRLVEQKSLNEIIGDNGYKVNYHTLLDNKEADRDKARKDWKTIGGIKELKEGYLSQVVHEICKLVVKYDAIIVMEDLNSGFMNSRKKVEKQVYQKFEKMLTDKLNYLVEKDKDVNEPGGLLNAYQLTNKAEGSRKGVQDGIIFYIPAWLTSKIDPTTGFVNLLNTKYKSVAAATEFINNVDGVSYNSETDMFEFEIDYAKFPRCQADFRKKWTVCSNGERIKTFRNEEKNSEWDSRTVVLTEEFKNLFERFGINLSTDLKEQITAQTDKAFFRDFMELMSLTLQMRNSITGRTDVDYLISPVRNSSGSFYDSRDYQNVENAAMPSDADANGAYNIARKGLWAVEQIRAAEDVSKVKLSISNQEWLEFAQKQ